MSENRDVDMTSIMVNHYANNSGLTRQQAATHVDSVIRAAANGNSAAIAEFGEMYGQATGKTLHDRDDVISSYESNRDTVLSAGASQTNSDLGAFNKKTEGIYQNNNSRITGGAIAGSVMTTLNSNNNPTTGIGTTSGASSVSAPGGFNTDPSERSPTAAVAKKVGENTQDTVDSAAGYAGRTAANVLQAGQRVAQGDFSEVTAKALQYGTMPIRTAADALGKAKAAFSDAMDGNPKK